MAVQEYFPVSIKKIVVDSIPDFDIYIRQKDRYVLYRKSNLRFGINQLEKLIENGIDTLHVRNEEHPRYKKYLSGASDESASLEYHNLFSDPEEIRRYHEIRAKYLSVDRTLFTVGAEMGFPLFILEKNRVRSLPEFVAVEEGPWKLGDSINRNGSEVLIRNEDADLYREYLEALFFADREISSDRNLTPVQIASVLRDTTKMLVREFLDDPKSGEKLKSLVDVTEELVDFAFANQSAVSSLLMIGSHDFLTYHHSVNVSFLCTGVGAELGLFRDDLLNLSLGGLLHDVGKSAIETEILNKPGLLSEEETKLVREHVSKGVALLWKHKDIPAVVVEMIAQHHERLNGAGYPEGLKADKISQSGRVLAITEVYDAMTTNRTYRKAAKPSAAVEYLEGSPEEFDLEITGKLKGLVGTDQK